MWSRNPQTSKKCESLDQTRTEEKNWKSRSGVQTLDRTRIKTILKILDKFAPSVLGRWILGQKANLIKIPLPMDYELPSIFTQWNKNRSIISSTFCLLQDVFRTKIAFLEREIFAPGPKSTIKSPKFFIFVVLL